MRKTMSWARLAAAGFLLAIATACTAPASAATSTDIGSELRTTADVVQQHGAAMVDHGGRLVASAKASTGPYREHWIADGQSMVAAGNEQIALAGQLRSAAALLGSDPTSTRAIDLGLCSGAAKTLTDDGGAVLAHGRAMVAHAEAMRPLVSAAGSGITEADVDLMAQDSANVVEAGDRIMRVGESLGAFVEKMSRSLGQR